MMITITKIKNKGIIAFLLLLIVTIGLLAYQNANDYDTLKSIFEQERKELESQLNLVIKDYEETSYKKIDISLKLRDELHNIIKLRDTIHNLKTTDYGLMSVYRKRIKNLANENKLLFSFIDSLSSINNDLTTKNDSVKGILVTKENQNIKLKHENVFLSRQKKGLKEKIAIAEIIETSQIKAIAVKKKRSGKYTSTSRSSKTDAFKIEFNLLENKIISPGTQKVYIQILDEEKNIVAPLKKIKLRNSKTITCSDFIAVEYYNKKLPFISFIKVNREKIHKGIYTINTFVNGVFSKSTLIKLR
ncbi:MAG: hypothetical protein ACPGU6_00550 [Tenacibaculum sp.]